MRLTLNLAGEAAQRVHWWRLALWAGVALLVAAAGAAQAIHYRSLANSLLPDGARLQVLQREVRRLEAQLAPRVPPETRQAIAALPARVEAYNQIITAGAFSWSGLLMELEASLPPHVGLTGIQADPASGVVTLQGQAKSFAEVTTFVHLLEQRPAFRDVYLLRHAEQGRSGGEGARLQDFTIRLHYGATG